MNAQKLSVFGGLKALLICAAVFYIGRWISDSRDPIMIWIGVIFSGFAALSVIAVFFSIFTASRKQAKQYAYSRYAHTESGNFGDAKIADMNTPVIQKLTTNRRGIFLGAYLNWLVFIDLFARGNAHWIIYAPARSGKTSCILTPVSLHFFEGNLIAPSIKRDTVAITKNFRRKTGHKFMEWNPYEVHGEKGLSINLLQTLIDDVRYNEGGKLQTLSLLIAETLISKSKKDDNPFFRNGAVRLLTGYMIFLATIRPWQCHLPGLNALVWSSDEERTEITALMTVSTKINGLVKKYGNHLADLFKPDYVKTFGPMRDYAIDATMIYDANTLLGKSLMSNDFSLKDALSGNTTFCPVLPEDKLMTEGKTIGLMMALLFEEISSLKNSVNTLVVLDEAGNFGHIPNLGKAMTLLPEKGLRAVLAFQSRNQCIDLYGENETKNMEKNASGISEWSISDPDDAKRWSTRTGKRTIKTYSMQYNVNDPHEPWRPSVSEKDHPVKSEYDLLTAPVTKHYVSMKGQPVIELDLVSYFEVKEWRENADLNPYHPNGYPTDKPVKFSLKDMPC